MLLCQESTDRSVKGTNMKGDPRVLLIGGTSHAGKTSLATFLASEVDGEHLSTDSLGRHPGRPWPRGKNPVPAHVADHYLTLSRNELLTDVLRHYAGLLPAIEDIISRRINDRALKPLFFEGSAHWPYHVADLVSENVQAVWLTINEHLLTQRIYDSSSFSQSGKKQKRLIQKFLDRSIHYNHQMNEAIQHLGLKSIEVTSSTGMPDLRKKIISSLSRQN